MTTTRASRPPGRPRSTRADEAIIEATLQLLAEGTTVEALSMEAIAARAGVGKATLYRRWSSKEDVLVDAIASLKVPLPELSGQSVRDDLVRLVEVVGSSQSSRAGRIMQWLLAELQRPGRLRDQYVALVEKRRDVLRAVIHRGIRTGELRADADVELTIALLTGPMYMTKLLGNNPRLDDDDLPDRLVDAVLRGVGG